MKTQAWNQAWSGQAWSSPIWSRLILVAGVLCLVAVSPGVNPARSDQQSASLLSNELQRTAPEHAALQRRADAVLQALLQHPVQQSANNDPSAFPTID